MTRWLLLMVLVLFSGCVRSPERVWQTLPSEEMLLARVMENTGRYNSLDAAARVGLTVKGRYFSTQQFLLLERPDRLRIDVLTGFGQLVLQLASDGRDMAVFLNDKVPGRFFYGPATYANISRFVRIPLATSDLLALLLYDPPLVTYSAKQVDIVDGSGLRLTLSGTDNHQELFFDTGLTLVGCRYYVDGELVLSVDYSKIDEMERFPRKVEIALPREDTRVTMSYSDLKLNTVLSARHFQLEQPENSVPELLP